MYSERDAGSTNLKETVHTVRNVHRHAIVDDVDIFREAPHDAPLRRRVEKGKGCPEHPGRHVIVHATRGLPAGQPRHQVREKHNKPYNSNCAPPGY